MISSKIDIYITLIDAEFDVEASVNKDQIKDGAPVITLSQDVAEMKLNKYTCIINGQIYSENMCMEICEAEYSSSVNLLVP